MNTKFRSQIGSLSLGGVGLWCLVTVGCASSTSTPPPASTPETPPPVAEAPPAPPPTPAAKLVFALEGAGLAHPEAVIYDAEQDVYFVSNINGDPAAKDKNGFISKVSPDGQVVALKFIDGSLAKTLLDAPKGMAISGDLLYVADLNHVRIFDRKSGAARGQLHGAGTTFLNGVSVDGAGTVFVTDTGWKSGANGFEATGSDAVLKIDPKKVKVEAALKAPALGNPNGLLATAGGLFVVNWQGEFYEVTKDGKQGPVTKLPKTQLDGLVQLADGSFLVSSWESRTIYQGKPGAEFTPVVVDMNSPAAIGFDSKRGRVLVPSLMDDRILVLELTGAAGAPPFSAPAVGATPAAAPAPAAAAPTTTAPAPAAPAAPTAAATATAAGPATATKPAAATPATPATPAKPASAASAAPGKPAAPAPAPAPAKPIAPTASAKPASPAAPAKVAAPAAAPAAPPKPAPASPAAPAKPAPAAPTAPAKPAAPAAPAKPAPAAPAAPAKPAPAAPAAPAKPAPAPAAPAAPAKPSGSAGVKFP